MPEDRASGQAQHASLLQSKPGQSRENAAPMMVARTTMENFMLIVDGKQPKKIC